MGMLADDQRERLSSGKNFSCVVSSPARRHASSRQPSPDASPQPRAKARQSSRRQHRDTSPAKKNPVGQQQAISNAARVPPSAPSMSSPRYRSRRVPDAPMTPDHRSRPVPDSPFVTPSRRMCHSPDPSRPRSGSPSTSETSSPKKKEDSSKCSMSPQLAPKKKQSRPSSPKAARGTIKTEKPDASQSSCLSWKFGAAAAQGSKVRQCQSPETTRRALTGVKSSLSSEKISRQPRAQASHSLEKSAQYSPGVQTRDKVQSRCEEVVRAASGADAEAKALVPRWAQQTSFSGMWRTSQLNAIEPFAPRWAKVISAAPSRDQGPSASPTRQNPSASPRLPIRSVLAAAATLEHEAASPLPSFASNAASPVSLSGSLSSVPGSPAMSFISTMASASDIGGSGRQEPSLGSPKCRISSPPNFRHCIDSKSKVEHSVEAITTRSELAASAARQSVKQSTIGPSTSSIQRQAHARASPGSVDARALVSQSDNVYSPQRSCRSRKTTSTEHVRHERLSSSYSADAVVLVQSTQSAGAIYRNWNSATKSSAASHPPVQPARSSEAGRRAVSPSASPSSSTSPSRMGSRVSPWSELRACLQNIPGVVIDDVYVADDWLDPTRASLRHTLIAKLGLTSDATVTQRAKSHGGLNMGIYELRDASKILILKLVTSTRFLGLPTEAERLLNLGTSAPSVISDRDVAFPVGIFMLFANDQTTRNLIAMKKVPGESLADILLRKLNKGDSGDIGGVLHRFGAFLAAFHARHGLQHGDCQPGNVFFDETSGRFSLIDIADMGSAFIRDSDLEHFASSLRTMTSKHGRALGEEWFAHVRRGYNSVSVR